MMKVILKAKPPIQILRTTRFGTLAKQALEKARSQGKSCYFFFARPVRPVKLGSR